MPPVPIREPVVSLPISIYDSSRLSTSGINFASLLLLGSSVYNPSISERRISKSAPVSTDTIDDKKSLSPNVSSTSWTATVSFSLTTGITPNLRSSLKVFSAFNLESGLTIVCFVKRTCAVT